MPDEYSDARYRELNRQLAKREQSTKRKARESLAARGALHSGMTGTTEREVEAQIGEDWTAGARDIEDRRWRAEQDELARKHQTGERIGSETFQTGERMGTQEWTSGETSKERDVRMKLQQMSDAERYRLQQLVNSGQMDLQDAEQEWTSYENDLNRQLEEWTTSGQWEQETGLQFTEIQQEQWAAMFGAESAMALQDDTQMFEHFMAQVGRKWELADRPWQEQMFLMDAQLQMLAAGYDWLNDNYNTGYPAWMISSPEEGTPFGAGTAYTYSPPTGATSGVPGYSQAPWLDAGGNPTHNEEEAVADNPAYVPPPPPGTQPGAPPGPGAWPGTPSTYNPWPGSGASYGGGLSGGGW